METNFETMLPFIDFLRSFFKLNKCKKVSVICMCVGVYLYTVLCIKCFSPFSVLWSQVAIAILTS